MEPRLVLQVGLPLEAAGVKWLQFQEMVGKVAEETEQLLILTHPTVLLILVLEVVEELLAEMVAPAAPA